MRTLAQRICEDYNNEWDKYYKVNGIPKPTFDDEEIDLIGTQSTDAQEWDSGKYNVLIEFIYGQKR